MAVKTNPVTVVEKNEGTKIEYEQNGTKLYFDDQLMINAAKFQKDWPVHVDVCMDSDRNLCTGVADGLYYVAQIDIPAIQKEIIEPEEEGGEPTVNIIPLDMADVVLTLWSIDQIAPAVQ